MVDLKKGLITAVIFYAVIFLVASMFMIAIPSQNIIFHALVWVAVIVVMFLLANYFYFKTKPTEPIKEGLILSALVLAVSVILDIPVMVYGFSAKTGWSWFAAWELWLGYVLIIATAIVAAKLKK